MLIDPTKQRYAFDLAIGTRWIVTLSTVRGLSVGDCVTVEYLDGRNFVRESDLAEFPMRSTEGMYVVVVPQEPMGESP